MGRLVVMALLLALGGPAIAQQQGPPAPAAAPDLAELKALGARTRKMLASRPAEWTAYYAVRDDFVVVHVLQAPGGRRKVDVAIEREGQRTPVLHVLERDGSWLVAEAEGANGAWRPWEAPLRLTFLIAPLAHALEPETLEELKGELGTFDGVTKGVARWSLASPDAALAAFGEDTEALRKWIAADATRRTDPAVRARVRALGRREKELEEGVVTHVDQATGLVVMAGLPGERRALAGFRWLEAVPEETFAPGVTPPVDGRGDPLAGGRPDDLVLFGACGYWTPQGGKTDPGSMVLDARLVDLKTGAARRLPVPGLALAGAWSRDRTKVYAVTDDEGGPWELELRSGRRRRLGGAPLAAGRSSYPALSPDGKTLAVVHRAGDAAPRVHLIDVASDAAARPLGPPLVAGCLSWLPAGDLLLAVRDPDGSDQVAVLGKDGSCTPLRAGKLPLAMADGKRFLFLDPAANGWCTADVAPGGPPLTPLLGGLPFHASPALSPDGTRILFVEGQSGQPVVYDLATGAKTTYQIGPGLWGSAVWR